MGRKKIKIERISAPKNRQVTFNKRKVGLMKKAMELSILCECDIVLIVFAGDQLFQYSSGDVSTLLKRWHAYDGPYEALTNKDLHNLKPGKSSSFRAGAQKRKRATLIPEYLQNAPSSRPISPSEHLAAQLQQHQQQQHLQQQQQQQQQQMPAPSRQPSASYNDPYMNNQSLLSPGINQNYGQMKMNNNDIPLLQHSYLTGSAMSHHHPSAGVGYRSSNFNKPMDDNPHGGMGGPLSMGGPLQSPAINGSLQSPLTSLSHSHLGQPMISSMMNMSMGMPPLNSPHYMLNNVSSYNEHHAPPHSHSLNMHHQQSIPQSASGAGSLHSIASLLASSASLPSYSTSSSASLPPQLSSLSSLSSSPPVSMISHSHQSTPSLQINADIGSSAAGPSTPIERAEFKHPRVEIPLSSLTAPPVLASMSPGVKSPGGTLLAKRTPFKSLSVEIPSANTLSSTPSAVHPLPNDNEPNNSNTKKEEERTDEGVTSSNSKLQQDGDVNVSSNSGASTTKSEAMSTTSKLDGSNSNDAALDPITGPTSILAAAAASAQKSSYPSNSSSSIPFKDRAPLASPSAYLNLNGGGGGGGGGGGTNADALNSQALQQMGLGGGDGQSSMTMHASSSMVSSTPSGGGGGLSNLHHHGSSNPHGMAGTHLPPHHSHYPVHDYSNVGMSGLLSMNPSMGGMSSMAAHSHMSPPQSPYSWQTSNLNPMESGLITQSHQPSYLQSPNSLRSPGAVLAYSNFFSNPSRKSTLPSGSSSLMGQQNPYATSLHSYSSSSQPVIQNTSAQQQAHSQLSEHSDTA